MSNSNLEHEEYKYKKKLLTVPQWIENPVQYFSLNELKQFAAKNKNPLGYSMPLLIQRERSGALAINPKNEAVAYMLKEVE